MPTWRCRFIAPGAALAKPSAEPPRTGAFTLILPVLSERLARLIGKKDLRFKLGLGISLLLHGLVLSLKLAAPSSPQASSPPAPGAPIQATLSPPRTPAPTQTTPPQTTPPVTPRSRVLAMPRRVERTPTTTSVPEIPERQWSQAERNEMDQFLNDLARDARPPTGADLAQRALAMARSMRLPPAPDSDESARILRKLLDAQVEPFSIEMYFNALFNKLNRSATMLGNQPRPKGIKAAAVRVWLNRDGTLKNFEILRVADQQGEIDYIRSVVELSVPFPAFPADIRRATDALVLQICIRPDLFGNGGGAAFSRMAPGEACR